MNVQELADKLDKVKNKLSMVQAKRSVLLDSLRTQYSLNSIEEAKAKLAYLKDDVSLLDEDIATKEKELMGLTDWSKV